MIGVLEINNEAYSVASTIKLFLHYRSSQADYSKNVEFSLYTIELTQGIKKESISEFLIESKASQSIFWPTLCIIWSICVDSISFKDLNNLYFALIYDRIK